MRRLQTWGGLNLNGDVVEAFPSVKRYKNIQSLIEASDNPFLVQSFVIIDELMGIDGIGERPSEESFVHPPLLFLNVESQQQMEMVPTYVCMDCTGMMITYTPETSNGRLIFPVTITGTMFYTSQPYAKLTLYKDIEDTYHFKYLPPFPFSYKAVDAPLYSQVSQYNNFAAVDGVTIGHKTDSVGSTFNIVFVDGSKFRITQQLNDKYTIEKVT